MKIVYILIALSILSNLDTVRLPDFFGTKEAEAESYRMYQVGNTTYVDSVGFSRCGHDEIY